MTERLPTATELGLLQCAICDFLVPKPSALAQHEHGFCPRCGARFPSPHYPSRRIEITWALLVAAIFLYIPAVTLPVMSFYLLGKGSPATIAEGVVQFLDHGQWPLALLIFVASLVIPIAKILALTVLLLSIHYRSRWRSKERLLLYKIIDTIGRWSMVDVFVVAIMLGLVQFGNIAYVEANIGSLSFAAVVVLTMIAARTLDERQIWEFERE